MRCAVIHGGVWEAGRPIAEGLNLIEYGPDGSAHPQPLYRVTDGPTSDHGQTVYIVALATETGAPEIVREAYQPEFTDMDALVLAPEAQQFIAWLQGQGWALVDTARSHRSGDRLEYKIVYTLEREADDGS